MNWVGGQELEIFVALKRILADELHDLPERGRLPHVEAGLGGHPQPHLVRLHLVVAGVREVAADLHHLVDEPVGHDGHAIIRQHCPDDGHGHQQNQTSDMTCGCNSYSV